MPDNPLLRRLITIPLVIVAFLSITVLSPLLVIGAALVDAFRAITASRPWMSLRAYGFLWAYLAGEVWALVALLLTSPLPSRIKIPLTHRLQAVWAAWNFGALRRLFSLDLSVDGAGSAASGPILVLSRHASMVDTLLPAHLIARPHGIKLRYVLKRELLVDPALDIAGHRLPNRFIDRDSGDSGELDAIRGLATGLHGDEGVLIYPEGTRFTEVKLRAYAARASGRGGVVGDISGSLRRVLPPRPGGTLALLEASPADVVVFAHRGLEGLATVKEIWGGGLVGSRIEVRMWRVGRSEIPFDRSGRVEWLYRLWAEVDSWVAIP